MKRLLSVLTFRQGTSYGNEPAFSRANTFFLCCGLCAALFLLFACDLSQGFGGPLLLAIASTLSGGAIGFLFGVPKSEETSEQSQLTYRQTVNTSLEQIADWLTKILVGLGLVNLQMVPEGLQSMAEEAARGIPALRSSAIAATAIVAFTILGFLYGYLTTRLYLSQAFMSAKRQEMMEAAAAIELTQIEKSHAKSTIAELPFSIEQQESTTSGKSGFDILRELSESYLHVNTLAREARIAEKSAIAAQMADLVDKYKIDRDLLAAEANEGLLMALVSAILVEPRTGDFDRLVRLTPKLTRLHIKYRTVLALIEIVSQNLVPRDAVPQAQRMLDLLSQNSDSDLLILIDRASAVIRTRLIS